MKLERARKVDVVCLNLDLVPRNSIVSIMQVVGYGFIVHSTLYGVLGKVGR